MVCRDLGPLGIRLNPELNETGSGERRVSAADSRVEVWVMPTNEEVVVARQARDLLSGSA